MPNSYFQNADIRDTPRYKAVAEFYAKLHAPGTDRVSDAADIAASPDGQYVAYTGTVFSDLASAPATRICITNLKDGVTSPIPTGAGSDHLPRYAPDGRLLAFLSDRTRAGDFQLHLFDLQSGATRAAPEAGGLVEYLHWSPDGRRILIGVAGYGADLAGMQGGATTVARTGDLPDWLPKVDSGDAAELWRWVCIFDVSTGEMKRAGRRGLNVWEANWLGTDSFVGVCTESHGEGSWYRAKLHRFDLSGSADSVVLSPREQIGVPSGSPDGKQVAVIEGVWSDRLIYCGRLLLIASASAAARVIDTHGADVTHIVWRDARTLAYTGLRGHQTVVGEVVDGVAREFWCATDRTFGNWYPSMWPLPRGGVVAIGESFATAPEIAIIDTKGYRPVVSLKCEDATCSHRMEPITWQARDGLEIQGWLLRPKGQGPFPTVMNIHGGPVWAYRDIWNGRLQHTRMMADMGYASFFPNPRGSSARGLEFARHVQGDMGGEDTHDYLTGLDHLVALGIADPKRLGVTGNSYGGFMSTWLITQDSRFAAAVPTSPVTNWASQHRTSQIPHFDDLFLGSRADDLRGRHYERSPAMFARNVRTPTLQLTGMLDQNTPPTQALEFHRALLEHGVESVCLFYPKAGHGIRTFPDMIDHVARKIEWFVRHMPPSRG